MGVNSECDSQHCCFGSYLIDLAIEYINVLSDQTQNIEGANPYWTFVYLPLFKYTNKF